MVGFLLLFFGGGGGFFFPFSGIENLPDVNENKVKQRYTPKFAVCLSSLMQWL